MTYIDETMRRLPGEPKTDYIRRVCDSKKQLKLSWEDVADIINDQTGDFRSANAYKLWYSRHVTQVDTSNQLSDVMLEIKKERVKLADERNQNNAYIRRLAREDTLKEIAYEIADKMSSKPLVSTPLPLNRHRNASVEAILQLSDWHYGIEVSNFWNTYNPEIAKERIRKLLASTIELINDYDITKLYVINLSDLIAGRIHTQIRLESRYDVITQIIHVSEILAEFLNELSNYCEVEYHATADNHSRIEPNKKQSLDLESLTRITHWYLKERLSDNCNICIFDNVYGEDIVTFKSLGHQIAAVHGDKDRPATVIDNISMMTEKHYDLILTAHLHHFSCDEKNRCDVVSNGSLMGTDSYAQSLRLSSKPSQNLIIVSEENPLYAIHRILV